MRKMLERNERTGAERLQCGLGLRRPVGPLHEMFFSCIKVSYFLYHREGDTVVQLDEF